MYEKGKPIVQNSGYGSCIIITPEGCKIQIMQIDIENNRVEVRKEVDISVDIEEVIRQQVMPGNIMDGEIREYMSMSPVDNEDELLCLSWLPDGTVERINGNPVYRWCEYVQAPTPSL